MGLGDDLRFSQMVALDKRHKTFSDFMHGLIPIGWQTVASMADRQDSDDDDDNDDVIKTLVVETTGQTTIGQMTHCLAQLRRKNIVNSFPPVMVCN